MASFAQQRLWMDERVRFRESINEHVAVYNELLIYTLSSETTLSINRLCQALSFVVLRHPILRTALFYNQEQLTQKVLPTTYDRYKIEITSITNDDHLKQVLYDEETNGILFNPEQGRVFRCHVLRRSHPNDDDGDDDLKPNDMIVFNFHHAAIDGSSILIFINDLQQALTTQSLSDNHHEETIDYLDYAQYERLEDWSEAQLYWTTVLKNFNNATDQQNSSLITGKGYTVTFELDHDLVIELNRFISQSELTLFQVGLAAFLAFLFKISNSQHVDLCTNIVVINRPYYQLQNIMGFFSNTLPFLVKLNPHVSFAQLCHQIQQLWLDILPHSHLPYQEIVKLTPQMRSSLMQTLFVLETTRDNTERDIKLSDGTQLTMTDRSLMTSRSSKFGIVCTLFEHRQNETISVSLNASLDLYDQSTISDMASRLKQIFYQLFAVSSIYQFNVLLSHEMKLIQDLNTTSIDYSPSSCIHWDFVDQVKQHPQKVALVLEHGSLTYGEVLYYAQLVASRLISTYAVQPGDKIAQLTERSFERVIGMISIWMSGGVYIPLSTYDSVKQISKYIRQSDTYLLLVHRSVDNLSLAHCSILRANVDRIICFGDINQQIPNLIDSVNVTSEHQSHILFTDVRPDTIKLVRNNINRDLVFQINQSLFFSIISGSTSSSKSDLSYSFM